MTHLLTHEETADILRLTPRQVILLARKGKLPAVRLSDREVRFDPDDIAEWVQSHKTPAGEGSKQ